MGPLSILDLAFVGEGETIADSLAGSVGLHWKLNAGNTAGPPPVIYGCASVGRRANLLKGLVNVVGAA